MSYHSMQKGRSLAQSKSHPRAVGLFNLTVARNLPRDPVRRDAAAVSAVRAAGTEVLAWLCGWAGGRALCPCRWRDELSAGNHLRLAPSLPDAATSVANYFAVRELWFQFLQLLTYFVVYQLMEGAHCCAVWLQSAHVRADTPKVQCPHSQGWFPLPHRGMQCQTR